MKPLHQEKNHIEIFRRNDNLDFVPHLHNSVELVLMLSGQSTAICETKRYPFGRGDLFIAFPGQVHGYESSQNCEAIVLVIPSNIYSGFFRDLFKQSLPASPLLSAGSWEQTGLEALLRMALQDRYSADPVLQGYALLIMSKLLPLLCLRPISEVGASPLQTILLYLNDHYTEPLTRSDIANAVGYSESYLSHLFSDLLHTSLSDYILTLRLDDACRLLINTELTVSQIAGRLGFGSIRSFNRAFQKKMTMAPSTYRNANR